MHTAAAAVIAAATILSVSSTTVRMREDQKAGAMLNLNVLYYRSSLIGIIRRDVVSRRGEGTREVVPERHWLVLHLGGFRGLRVRAAFNDSPSW